MLYDFIDTQSEFCHTVLQAIEKNKKISHAYFIETNAFAKGRELVLAFAKFLLCQNRSLKEEEIIRLSHLVDQNNYPDLKIIEPDGQWIKKEQLLDLQAEFKTMSEVPNGMRIYIIFEADKLNRSAANAMLKFLEEPEDNIIAILVGKHRYQMIDTIISRCQIFTLINHDSLEEEHPHELVDVVVDFAMDLSRRGSAMIAYVSSKWKQMITTRENYLSAFLILEDFYDWVLKYQYGFSSLPTYFQKFENDIHKIAKNNSNDVIIKKLEVIRNYIERLQYNVNLNLFLDSFILSFSEVKS